MEVLTLYIPGKVYVCMYVCMYVCVCMCMCVCNICTHIHTLFQEVWYSRSRASSGVDIVASSWRVIGWTSWNCAYRYVCMYVYMCMYVCIYYVLSLSLSHTHTYIYIHTDNPSIPFVICAPTMRVPMILQPSSINPYLATRAVLLLIRYEYVYVCVCVCVSYGVLLYVYV